MDKKNSIKITIPGNIRSKKNSKQVCMIGGKNAPRRPMILPSKAYKQWEKAARAAVLEQIEGMAGMPTMEDVEVKAVAYCKGRLPDLSGMLESVGDCLEGIIWADDRQIKSWDGSRVVRDKERQRVEVEVVKIKGE